MERTKLSKTSETGTATLSSHQGFTLMEHVHIKISLALVVFSL